MDTKPIRADRLVEGYKAIGMIVLNRAPLAFLSAEDRIFIAGDLDLVKYLPPALPLSKVFEGYYESP